MTAVSEVETPPKVKVRARVKAEPEPALAAANLALDAAIERARRERRLVRKLAVDAHYERDKGSYCFGGMNDEIIRLHLPRFKDEFPDPVSNDGRMRSFTSLGARYRYPEDSYDGVSGEAPQAALEAEDRGLYSARGLLDLARRITAGHDKWRKQVEKCLNGKARGYYTREYLTSCRSQLGFETPFQFTVNGIFEFGYLGNVSIPRNELLAAMERAFQSALNELDPAAIVNSAANRPGLEERGLLGQISYHTALRHTETAL